jgi:hypothetical protein
MARLPRNPTARLRAVADIIEQHPEKHDQNSFTSEDAPWYSTYEAAGSASEVRCGTTACVAGWAVLLTPKSQTDEFTDDWSDDGAKALGLDDDLASEIFYGWSNRQRRWIPDWLRALADIPTGKRTLDEAMARGIVR